MMKESQKFEAGPDGKKTDKVLSWAEDEALMAKDISTHSMYQEMVKEGKLDEESVFDKDGKIIGVVIKEKDVDGKPGKILYFRDENMIKAMETNMKKSSRPVN